MIVRPSLDHQPTVERFRGPITRGLSVATGAVKRGNGAFGAGLIQGVAIVTRGEALGHGYWLDGSFLDQTQTALGNMTRSDQHGAKARFTHPDMSSDGMGKKLGRFRYGKRDGDIVRGNLHFYASAHKTPEGDLAGYVMSLAEEDPRGFGTSIVFMHDWPAELEFAVAHGAVEKEDEMGKYLDTSAFSSPDPDNVNGYIHARLAELLAVDVVDDPAANPGGLFYRDPVFADAEATASFALGLTHEAPAMQALSVDPRRVQIFVKKFLDRHDLTLVKKPKETEPVTTSAAAPAADAALSADAAGKTQDTFAAYRAELKRFREQFGTQGVEWFEAGKTFEEATQLHAALTAARAEAETTLTAMRAENDQLKAQLTAVKQQTEPVTSMAADDAHDGKPGGKVALKSLIRLPARK